MVSRNYISNIWNTFFRLSEKCKTKYYLLQGRPEKWAKSFIIAVKGLVFGSFIAPTNGGEGACSRYKTLCLVRTCWCLKKNLFRS